MISSASAFGVGLYGKLDLANSEGFDGRLRTVAGDDIRRKRSVAGEPLPMSCEVNVGGGRKDPVDIICWLRGRHRCMLMATSWVRSLERVARKIWWLYKEKLFLKDT